MNKHQKGTPNVYADLGLPDAGEMLVKAQLATRIAMILKRERLTQTAAATRLGLTQPRLSNLLRGNFRGISEAKMMDCLAKLGSDVEIVVKPAHRARANPGRVFVTIAGSAASPAPARVRERGAVYRAGGSGTVKKTGKAKSGRGGERP